jgi:magnesium chelatase family protein
LKILELVLKLEEEENLLETAVTKLGLSAGAYDRARTIADLAGEEEIGTGHISEAVPYRMMDRVR